MADNSNDLFQAQPPIAPGSDDLLGQAYSRSGYHPVALQPVGVSAALQGDPNAGEWSTFWHGAKQGAGGVAQGFAGVGAATGLKPAEDIYRSLGEWNQSQVEGMSPAAREMLQQGEGGFGSTLKAAIDHPTSALAYYGGQLVGSAAATLPILLALPEVAAGGAVVTGFGMLGRAALGLVGKKVAQETAEKVAGAAVKNAIVQGTLTAGEAAGDTAMENPDSTVGQRLGAATIGGVVGGGASLLMGAVVPQYSPEMWLLSKLPSKAAKVDSAALRQAVSTGGIPVTFDQADSLPRMMLARSRSAASVGAGSAATNAFEEGLQNVGAVLGQTTALGNTSWDKLAIAFEQGAVAGAIGGGAFGGVRGFTAPKHIVGGPEQTQTKAEDTAQAAPKPQEQTATAPQIAPQIAPEARTIIRDLMGSVPDLTPEVQQKIADTIATKIPSALDTPTAIHKFIDTLAQTTDMPKERVVADFFVRSMYQTPEADAYRTTLNNLFKDVNDFKLPTITAQDFITGKAADVVQESHDAVSRRISQLERQSDLIKRTLSLQSENADKESIQSLINKRDELQQRIEALQTGAKGLELVKKGASEVIDKNIASTQETARQLNDFFSGRLPSQQEAARAITPETAQKIIATISSDPAYVPPKARDAASKVLTSVASDPTALTTPEGLIKFAESFRKVTGAKDRVQALQKTADMFVEHASDPTSPIFQEARYVVSSMLGLLADSLPAKGAMDSTFEMVAKHVTDFVQQYASVVDAAKKIKGAEHPAAKAFLSDTRNIGQKAKIAGPVIDSIMRAYAKMTKAERDQAAEFVNQNAQPTQTQEAVQQPQQTPPQEATQPVPPVPQQLPLDVAPPPQANPIETRIQQMISDGTIPKSAAILRRSLAEQIAQEHGIPQTPENIARIQQTFKDLKAAAKGKSPKSESSTDQGARAAVGEQVFVARDPRGPLSVADIPETIEVDGVQRPTRNSNGQPIAATEEGIRNFWRWFGSSRVVDDQGRPLVVYHGTKGDFAEFQLGRADRRDGGWFGDGFYLTASQDLASSYAMRERDYSLTDRPANVMPVYVRMSNPYRINLGELSYDEGSNFTKKYGGNEGFRKWLADNGYDGVIGYRDPEIAGQGAEFWEVVVFDPAQIKSATGNRGTFDPANPDIRYSIKPSTPRRPTGGVARDPKAHAVEISRAAEQLTQNWKAPVEINVVHSDTALDRLPSEVLDLRDSLQARGADAAAVYHKGKIYVFSDAIRDPEHLAQVLAHEGAGHFGLRAVLGNDARFNAVLDEIAATRRSDLAPIAQLYGLDLNKPDQARIAAEEYIARMAESLPSMGWGQRVLSYIRALWASITGRQWTDDQIIQHLLIPAQTALLSQRVESDPELSDAVRAMATTTKDIAFTPAEDWNRLRDARVALSQGLTRIVDQLSFTFRLLDTLQQKLPSAQKLREVFATRQAIRGTWERVRQEVGMLAASLDNDQLQAAAKALIHYSSTRTLPGVLDTPTRIAYDGQGDVIEVGHAQDIKIDPSVLNSLPDDKTKQFVKTVMNMMARVNIEQARAEIKLALAARDAALRSLGSEASLAQSGTLLEQQNRIQKYYDDAVQKIIAVTNERLKAGYVPQIRRGEYVVVAKSHDFVAAENDTDHNAIAEMRRDPQHFQYIGATSKAEAVRIQEQLLKAGYAAVSYHMRQAEATEYQLNRQQVATLLAAVDASGDMAVGELARESVSQVAERVLLELINAKDIRTASMLERENIAGIRPDEIMPNVLDLLRSFGSYYASLATTNDRISAIANMRRELRMLPPDDNVRYTTAFNTLLARLDDTTAEKDTIIGRLADRIVGFGALSILLTNISYYVLQLTQPWMVSMPVLAGRHGWGSTVDELTKAYTKLSDTGIYKDLFLSLSQAQTVVNFDMFDPRHRDLLETLQSRQLLDVGMASDFDALMGGRLAVIQYHLRNKGRGVELVNRAATALAAYDLEMQRLKALRRPDSELSLERMHKEAVDYAAFVIDKTHGDYSYANAPEIFRNPLGRVALQFKKIAFIMADMLAYHLQAGFKQPGISDRTKEVLAKAKALFPSEIVDKVLADERLSDNELRQMQAALIQVAKAYDAQAFPYSSTDPSFTHKDAEYLSRIPLAEFGSHAYITTELQTAARKSLLNVLTLSALVGGSKTVPFLTTILALAARGIESDDAPPEESDEERIMRVFGPEVGQFILYGLAGKVLGVDISRRIGVNFVDQILGSYYRPSAAMSPKDQVKDALANLTGPFGSILVNEVSGLSYLSKWAVTGDQHDLIKAVVNMIPLSGLRSALTAYLWSKEGIATDSNVTLISPDEIKTQATLSKFLGFQPIEVAELYRRREEQANYLKEVTTVRTQLVQAYIDAYKAGDTRRMRLVEQKWVEMQKLALKYGMRPTPITRLRSAVKANLKRELQMDDGLLNTPGMPSPDLII